MSGVGRGRGWLNIKREQLTPGGIMITTSAEEDPIQTYLSYIDNTAAIPSKYSKAFHGFETISSECVLKKTLEDYQYNDDDIRQCVILLMQEYLVNWNMSFHAISNAYKIDRKAVLNSAQKIYENNKFLFKKSKTALVKLLIMLAKLHGILQMPPICAFAAIECGKLLLEPVHIEYVPIFTKCLHQINSSKKVTRPTEQPIDENSTTKDQRLGDILREAICATNDAKTRYWLFLARDIWISAPEILSEETLAFYDKHLGQTEMNYFRQAVINTTIPHNVSNETHKPDVEQPLHLDTNQSLHSLDQYVSKVSVLKIDDSPSSQERNKNDFSRVQIVHEPTTDLINSATTSHHHSRHNCQPSPITDNHQQILKQHITDNSVPNDSSYQPKMNNAINMTGNGGGGGGGRAILGSGARKNRNNSGSKQQSKLSPRDGGVYDQQQEVNGWREEPTNRGGSGGVSRPPPRDLPRNHSAWNHDDRC